jgi:DNA-binding transcriptional MerR regulator
VKSMMTVGRVARATGVSPDTVRYYERLRLLPSVQRSPSGYRIFELAEVDRIRAIKRAQLLGMSLAEIQKAFPFGKIGRGECRRVRSLLARKIAETESRITDLRRFKSQLAAHLRACDTAIERGGDLPCPVFDTGVSSATPGRSSE